MTERGGRAKRGGRRLPPKGRAGRSGAPGRHRAEGRADRKRLGLSVRQIQGIDHALVHPPCVEERREDYEEGLEIWRAGEFADAREALRYALEGCGDNLWVHVALGRIAIEADGDPSLARGHFGYAYELVRKALPRGFAGRLPREAPANQPLYDAIEGLAGCLDQLDEHDEANALRVQAARWAGETN